MGLLRHEGPFPAGFTELTPLDDEAGLQVGVLRLPAGAAWHLPEDREGALLLLDGAVRFQWAGGEEAARRGSLFTENPVALHVPAGSPASVRAETDAELAVLGVQNAASFAPGLFTRPLESEERGQGVWDDTAWRVVRTVFDLRNRPEARLVLGEVVNRHGRWSSYPPHHHPQPEVYHYRFPRPQGYGHAELGEQVFRVRSGDTLRIAPGLDHAQVAAPGYAMWYLWAIRHIPGAPYTGFEVAPDHRWLLER